MHMTDGLRTHEHTHELRGANVAVVNVIAC